MPCQYKKVLVIGATSGIGEALADKLVSEGSFVIVTGRRQENLKKFVDRHGRDKAEGYEFDISNLESIPTTVENITRAHSDIDCVVLNAGIQRRSDWSEPESIDIKTIQLEFATNYFAYLALTKELIPVLRARGHETALVYISSNLALVPLPPRSNYCATKAALHQWILCLRVSLQNSNIKVIEIYPPAVQTELHDERHQPDIKNGRDMGMPLDEFTEAAWAGLSKGNEDIPVSVAEHSFNAIETARRTVYGQLLEKMGMARK